MEKPEQTGRSRTPKDPAASSPSIRLRQVQHRWIEAKARPLTASAGDVLSQWGTRPIMRVPHVFLSAPFRTLPETSSDEVCGLAQQLWTVNGLGDYSEIYSHELQTWVKTSKRVLRPSGLVEAAGLTDSGERVTFEMNPGECRRRVNTDPRVTGES